MKDYKKILEGVVNIINTTEKSDIGFVNICSYIGENCPELKESEDERIRKWLIGYFNQYIIDGMPQVFGSGLNVKDVIAWLEKQGEKIDAIENFDTEFEKQISRLLASVLSKEYEYTECFVKWVSNSLLGYAKHEIEKQGEQNHDWGEEDEKNLEFVISQLKIIIDEKHFAPVINWLKSLRPQSLWKPSKEQMLAINTAINVLGKGTLNGKQLIELQEQLKRLKRE